MPPAAAFRRSRRYCIGAEQYASGVDGRRQRNALTAAEHVVTALAAGSVERALENAAKAAELDQIGVFATLPVAVAGAVAELRDTATLSNEGWAKLCDALPPGPMQALVDAQLR
jgi:hypothetical protein